MGASEANNLAETPRMSPEFVTDSSDFLGFPEVPTQVCSREPGIAIWFAVIGGFARALAEVGLMC